MKRADPKNMKKYFITGTDTGIGKTHISLGLLHAFNRKGFTTVGLKPLASGCHMTTAGLRNEDALAIQQIASVSLDYENINPFAFESPIAPYIAAQRLRQTLTLDNLLQACEKSLTTEADIAVIEGVGGWYQPLNDGENMIDFVTALDLSVILVVGMRLGCINHALLTYKMIRLYKVNLAGWVANCIDPEMLALEENIELLTDQFSAPLLAKVPYQQKSEDIQFNCGYLA